MRFRLPLTAVGLAAIGLCGCTLVGFGIGKAVDHSGSHGPKPLVQQDLLTLRLGEPLEVQLWDGTKLSGRFRGLHWMSPGDYGPAYESARAGRPEPPPARPRRGAGEDERPVHPGRVPSGSGPGSSPWARREDGSPPSISTWS